MKIKKTQLLIWLTFGLLGCFSLSQINPITYTLRTYGSVRQQSLTKPTFKSKIDLKYRQTVPDWINFENQKAVSDQIRDLVAENKSSLTQEQVGEIVLVQKNKDQVEVSLKLREDFQFSDGSKQTNQQIKLINFAPQVPLFFSYIVVGGAGLVSILLLALGFGIPIRRKQKIEKLMAEYDERRLARLSIANTLAFRKLSMAGGVPGQSDPNSPNEHNYFPPTQPQPPWPSYPTPTIPY